MAFATDPGLRQVGSLAQLIQAKVVHSADSGAFSPPAIQTPPEFYGQATLSAPHWLLLRRLWGLRHISGRKRC